jgi:hypothetical protein
MTPSGIEHTIFRLLSQCFNKLRQSVPPEYKFKKMQFQITDDKKLQTKKYNQNNGGCLQMLDEPGRHLVVKG